MKSRKRRYAFPGIVFLMSTIFALTAFAGSINGNEQSVISVIHGQFEKDGTIYAVKQEYINSAVSYLSRDDVDLTAEQAQEVISEIYANVQTGVESGYLVAVSSPAGEAQTESGVPAETKPAGQQVKPEGNGTDQPSPDVSEASGESPADSESPAEQTTAQPETTEPETVPEVISILELVDKAPPQSYGYISRDTDALMEKVHIPYNILMWLSAALAAVMLVICGIAVRGKLFTSHRHRKFRGILKAVLTAETVVLTTMCLSLISLWLAAFQDSAVLNKLAETGYYNTIYSELRRDTSVSFALLDIPDEVMDSSITYERVVLAARQQVESDLSSGIYHADTSMLTSELESDIQAYLENKSVVMTDQAENGLNLLMDRLEEKYDSLLRWPFAFWWVSLCAGFFQAVRILLPADLFLLIAGQVMILLLNHYKHRGLSMCGKGILGGSVLLCLGSVIGMVWSSQVVLNLEPSYMKLFFDIYRNGIWRTGLLTGGIGILVGIVYLLIVKAWKEGKK